MRRDSSISESPQASALHFMKQLHRNTTPSASRSSSISSAGDPFLTLEWLEKNVFHSIDSTSLANLMKSDIFMSAGDSAGRDISERATPTPFNSAGGLTSDFFVDADDFINLFQSFCDEPCLKSEPVLKTEPPDQERPSTTKGDNKRERCPKKEREENAAIKNYIVGDYTDVDVLMGRGGLSNRHAGNKAYLQEKERMQERYRSATKDAKTGISQELVDWVRARGGRFLKQDDDDEYDRDGTTNNKRWYEVDDVTARKKASQTLREVNTPENRALKRARHGRKN